MGEQQPQAERVPEDRLLDYARAVGRHFHESEEVEDARPYLRAFEQGYRAWWIRHQDRIVANLGVIETDLSLPGGARVPVAGITAVGVAQAMRRRGLLTTLMAGSLSEARARGEPVAALYASESAIYARYGFGIAAPHLAYRADRLRLRFRDPVDVRLVEETSPEAARSSWPAIHEALRQQRGGSVGYTPGMWHLGLLEDPPGWRDGATARRLVEVPGRGYARYRVRARDDAHRPAGTVLLGELVATDPEAESALWQHVLDIDLTAQIESWIRPPDDAIAHLLTDPLALGTFEGPPLYVRILDVARLFTDRSYGTTGAAVIAVLDPVGPAGGRWLLEVDPSGARCEPTSRAPDVTLPIDALSGIVFGGVRATSLVAGRRISEARPGAAAALDRLVAVERAPWTTMMF
ncbi:MAG: GNAT family N-acetyltransferase [Nitriliruptoraceae bacterium]